MAASGDTQSRISTPRAVADAALRRYRGAFGLTTPRTELRYASTTGDALGAEHVLAMEALRSEHQVAAEQSRAAHEAELYGG